MPVLFPIGQFDAGPRPTRAAAPVTIGLITLCVAVFVGPQDGGQAAEWPLLYGLTPARFIAEAPGLSRQMLAPVTSLFTHASWLHLLYNLIALWVFGAAVERAVGRARFAALFIGLGALAMLAQAVWTPASSVPIVGASGAVAAVAGAFAVAYPRSRILLAAVFLTVPVRAWIILSLWMAVEVVALWDLGADAGGLAHVAHLAGFILGALLMTFLARTGRIALPGFQSPV